MPQGFLHNNTKGLLSLIVMTLKDISWKNRPHIPLNPTTNNNPEGKVREAMYSVRSINFPFRVITSYKNNNNNNEALGWLIIKHLPLAQVMIPGPWIQPRIGAPCSAGSLLLPLPLPLLVFPLSLSFSVE